jgi:Thoeris protein ThsB, TIR-like domain
MKPPESGRRNVFISFTNEDKPMVELLRGQAQKEDSTVEFNDWSLRAPFDSERAETIREGIRERIRQASLTLVYVSDHTAKSKWVNWEVEESVKLEKKVVGVYQGELPGRLPPAIKKHSIRVIAWTHKGIAKVLK